MGTLVMDERERVIREVIKVLPELAKSLSRDVAAHAATVAGGGRAPAPAPSKDADDSHAGLAHDPHADRTGDSQTGEKRRAPGGPVSTAQVRALIHPAQYGPQTMGELAEGLQIATASATGLINPLVSLGYVIRSRDPNDRRVVRVGLSSEAQIIADAIIAEWRREVEAALEGMDLAACRSFLEGLERLAGRQIRHTTRHTTRKADR